MANYIRHTEAKKMNMVNPYPGLRPYTTRDSRLFFGRSKEVEELLSLLMNKRFAAVTGEAGSGKTSLINAGLIPSLMYQGEWILFKIRPGSTPLQDLFAEIMKKLGKDSGKISATTFPEAEDILKIFLEMHKEYQAGILIVIDQFEEIFTQRGPLSEKILLKNRERFIDFLLQAVGQQEIPVHVAVTIRSDFLDECSAFGEFSDLLDLNKYPLERMSSENITRAIMGPLEVSGISIQRDLVRRIISDVQENPDILPVLQHALMRTWQNWNSRKDTDSQVSIEDYNLLGSVDHAISKFADEAYGQLSDEEKGYCERIFRALSERDDENRDVCTPRKISKISEITQVPVEKVIRIADIFRREGRGFLSPYIETPLDKNSVLSVSHESLMKLWYRLDEWADEEYESVQMYLNLAEAAELYQVGKAELWRPPELETALEWYRNNKPNLPWAERYNPAFERTLVFLTTSEREFSIEEEERFQVEKRKRIINRVLTGALGVTVVIAIVIFYFQHVQKPVTLSEPSTGITNSVQETENAGQAGDEIIQTQEAKNENQNSQDVKAKIEASEQPKATNTLPSPVTPPLSTVYQEESSQKPVTVSPENQNIGGKSEGSLLAANAPVEQKTVKTDQRQGTSNTEVKMAESASNKPPSVNAEMVIPVIRSMTDQLQQINGDPDLYALVAYQAYLFNKEYNGDNFNATIYTDLYKAVRTFRGEKYNVYEGHSNTVRTLDFIPNTSTMFTGGSDGTILKWDLNDSKIKPGTVLSGRNIIDMIKVTSNGKWLLFAESNVGLSLINLSGTNMVPDQMTGSERNIRTIAPAPDNNSVYTAGLGNYIEVWNITLRSARKLTDTEAMVNSLSLSPDGSMLAGGLRNGKTMIWNLKENLKDQVINTDERNAVQTVQFSRNGKYLACGALNGNILMFRTSDFKLLYTLRGHKARITSIAFNPDGKSLVSGSYDGQVVLWNLSDPSQPVTMNDNTGFVFTVGFSPDGKYFLSGSAKEPRLVARPGDVSGLASQICMLVKRDMTQEEWNTYVGNDIPYRNTCSDR